MVNQNRAVFLQALVLTIIVFIIGIIIGMELENSRANKTELALLNSEILLLDEQVRSNNLHLFNISCELSVKSTFDFADRIYREALLLEKYDASSKFNNELRVLHKKYDLLRTMLWTRGIEIKKQCPQKFHTVVYLFDYASEDIDKKSLQAAFSRLLLDLKEKHEDKILLIPIASNLKLESVNLIKEKYAIKEAPAIIIDEKKIVRKLIPLKDLEDIVFEEDNFEQLKGKEYEEIVADKQNKIVLNPVF